MKQNIAVLIGIFLLAGILAYFDPQLVLHRDAETGVGALSDQDLRQLIAFDRTSNNQARLAFEYGECPIAAKQTFDAFAKSVERSAEGKFFYGIPNCKGGWNKDLYIDLRYLSHFEIVRCPDGSEKYIARLYIADAGCSLLKVLRDFGTDEFAGHTVKKMAKQADRLGIGDYYDYYPPKRVNKKQTCECD